jgi:hypothetical protein
MKNNSSSRLENGLWSTKFIMPEHKVALMSHGEKNKEKPRPILHEDEWETIFQNLQSSLNQKEEITVTAYGLYEDRDVSGIVVMINENKSKFKVEFEDGFEWIDFDEIVNVTSNFTEGADYEHSN